MPRYLLLLRHAKSDWDAAAASDFERPLSKRGRKDARRMGRWMREEDLAPDCVIASPARRARETALRVCRELAIPGRNIRFNHQLYEADVAALLAVLAGCPQTCSNVMLVGHNPGLADLLAWLWGENVALPEDGKLMPTATLARLRMPRDWTRLERGCARTVVLTRPRSLAVKQD
jgi:phosphohistidine phosphatase